MRNLRESPITQAEKEHAIESAIDLMHSSDRAPGDLRAWSLKAVLVDSQNLAASKVTEREWLRSEIGELESLIAAIPADRVIELSSFKARLDRTRGKLEALGPAPASA